MVVKASGYGHKIIDGDQVIYTSQEAMAADVKSLMKMLGKSAEMLSELINVSPEEIVHDLYEISGCDMMREAFNTVLAKQNKTLCIQTRTEKAFNDAKQKLNND